MAKILYYVTNHGLGHATRTIAITRELFEIQNDLQITFITSGRTRDFLKNSLVAFKGWTLFHDPSCDIGLKLKGFDEPNVSKMKAELSYYVKNVNESVKKESEDLKGHELIISDAVPHAFEVADRMKVPGVLLSNFTWYKMYEGILGNLGEVKLLGEMYSKATHTIQLAGYSEMNYGKVIKRGWYSRKPNVNDAEKIRKGILSNGYKKIIYIGMGMSTQMESILDEMLEKNNKYAFIVSSGFPKKYSNMFKIPGNYLESQNYVCAADICVIKSGWSTVSECITMNKPMIIVERKKIPEDVNTQKFLELNYGIRIVSKEKLRNVDFESIEKPSKKESNDEKIVEDLIDIFKEV